MADRIILTNDAVGNHFGEQTFFVGPKNATSAAAGASVTTEFVAGPMPANGRIVEFSIGVVEPALSAAGFISGNISANLRINSVSCLTTLPAILGPVANSAATVRKTTNAGGGTSAVLNAASTTFSAGDFLTWDYNVQSAASAAPGNTAVKGLVGIVRVRYAAT